MSPESRSQSAKVPEALNLDWAEIEREAEKNRREAADELTQAKWSNFKLASQMFTRHPARSTWRAFVGAAAELRVAFQSEGPLAEGGRDGHRRN